MVSGMTIIMGYVPPTSLGYGTWVDITPSQGIIRIETERNIGGGDSARIILSGDTDFTEFEAQRAIQIWLYDTAYPTCQIWEGFIISPEIGHHKPWPNLLTYDIQCVGYEKVLMRKEITKTWTLAALDTIFEDLANEANANMRFPTVKRFKYDTSKLTNYDGATYSSSIIKEADKQKIWDVLKELTPLLDGLDYTNDYQYSLYLDYLQSSSYIYLMPDMLDTEGAAVFDFSDDATIYTNSKTVKRNYDQVINYCHAVGDGVETSHYSSTLLAAGDIVVPTDNYDFDAATIPSARNYIALEIQNDAAGYEYGSFSIDGYDAPLGGNPLTEDIYFHAGLLKTTTLYSKERYGDLKGVGLYAFNIRNMTGATINVYEILHGVAGRSIHDYGICALSPQRLDLNTQGVVDSYAQQEVKLYHNPPTEITFRALDFTPQNLLNQTVLVTNPFTDTAEKFLVTKQKYVIPSSFFNTEMWITGIHTDYAWE